MTKKRFITKSEAEPKTEIKKEVDDKPIIVKRPVLEMKEEPLVRISLKAYAKISYFLQKRSAVEWSALMMYTTEGSVSEPETFICTVEDIYLMDIGSAASTSHDYNGMDMIDAFDKHPEYEKMIIGHIHSHNTMAVFFSGTDLTELTDNAPNHLHYLSLVVNNKGEMIAKIATIAKSVVERRIHFKNENIVNEWLKKFLKQEEEQEVIAIYDCKIALNFPDALETSQRLEELSKRVVTTPRYTYPRYNKQETDKEREDRFKSYYDRYYDSTGDVFEDAMGSHTPIETTPTVIKKKGIKAESHNNVEYLLNDASTYDFKMKVAKMLVACTLDVDDDIAFYQYSQKEAEEYRDDLPIVISNAYDTFYRSEGEGIFDHFALKAFMEVFDMDERFILNNKYRIKELMRSIAAMIYGVLVPVRDLIIEVCDNIVKIEESDLPAKVKESTSKEVITNPSTKI